MSVFLDKSVIPTDKQLQIVLGNYYNLWVEIKKSIENEHGQIDEEWKHYGAKSGWTLKLLLKKRNLFFFAPYDSYFNISFVFGDRAVAEIENSSLPITLIEEVKNARKYAKAEV